MSEGLKMKLRLLLRRKLLKELSLSVMGWNSRMG
jgi:hypothetical protein